MGNGWWLVGYLFLVLLDIVLETGDISHNVDVLTRNVRWRRERDKKVKSRRRADVMSSYYVMFVAVALERHWAIECWRKHGSIPLGDVVR